MQQAFTEAETLLADKILAICHNPDTLDAENALLVFTRSGLPPETLLTIWDIADVGSKGFLHRSEVFVAVRLIGWAQHGERITEALCSKHGPMAELSPATTESSPYFSPQNEDKPRVPTPPPRPAFNFRPLPSKVVESYKDAFQKANPIDGVLPVDRVLQIMQQSGLSSSVLTGITDLVSPARGDFTFPNFVLSMYLLFGILEDEFVAIPAAIPDWLLEQINGLEDIKGKKRDLPRQSQAGTSAISSSLDRERAFTLDFRLYSKQASENKALDPRFCAVVPQELRDISDNYFDNLANSDQVVPGDVAVPFLLGSKLPMRDLASIWDLADYEQQGALNSYGFSLSILFTYRKMAGGQIPLSLPSSFLPKVVDDAQVAREEGMKSQIQQLRLENRHLRSQSMMESPETGELRRQVADLLRTLQGKTDEIAGLQQTIHSQTQNEDDQVDDPLISDQLERAEQENENLRSKLQFMADEVEAYRKTNEMLQKHVQNLTQQADHVKADSLTVQNLLREDANRQIEELRRQVNELRSSTRLPSAGDDEDIQTLINEQLASDNASLRTQVKQLQDSLAQMENRNLQPIPHARSSTPDLSAHGSISPTASQYPFPSPSIFTEGRSTEPQDGLDKRKTRKLRRRSQKDLEESFAASEALLRRRVQELQTQFQDLETRYKFELDQVRGRSTREAEESRSRAEQLQAQMDASEQDFRRRISRLTQENETLKRERERERQGTSQSQDSESVPPPAYEELLNN